MFNGISRWKLVSLMFTDNYSPTTGSWIQSSPFPASEPGSRMSLCQCSSSCSGFSNLPRQTFTPLPYPRPPCLPIFPIIAFNCNNFALLTFEGESVPTPKHCLFYLPFILSPRPGQGLVKNMPSVNTWRPDGLVKIFQNQVLQSSKQQCYFLLFLI